MTELPYPLLVILVILAIIAGLWVGSRANEGLETARGKSLGKRVRGLMSQGMISLWKWNRGRQQKKRKPEKT